MVLFCFMPGEVYSSTSLSFKDLGPKDKVKILEKISDLEDEERPDAIKLANQYGLTLDMVPSKLKALKEDLHNNKAGNVHNKSSKNTIKEKQGYRLGQLGENKKYYTRKSSLQDFLSNKMYLELTKDVGADLDKQLEADSIEKLEGKSLRRDFLFKGKTKATGFGSEVVYFAAKQDPPIMLHLLFRKKFGASKAKSLKGALSNCSVQISAINLYTRDPEFGFLVNPNFQKDNSFWNKLSGKYGFNYHNILKSLKEKDPNLDIGENDSLHRVPGNENFQEVFSAVNLEDDLKGLVESGDINKLKNLYSEYSLDPYYDTDAQDSDFIYIGSKSISPIVSPISGRSRRG